MKRTIDEKHFVLRKRYKNAPSFSYFYLLNVYLTPHVDEHINDSISFSPEFTLYGNPSFEVMTYGTHLILIVVTLFDATLFIVTYVSKS